nr:collagen alpha-2(I) chain-like [Gorilla gorilla gorilla]
MEGDLLIHLCELLVVSHILRDSQESPWAVDGTGCCGAGGGAPRGGSGRAGAHGGVAGGLGTQAWRAAGPEPCPAGRQLRPGEKLSAAPVGQHCWGSRSTAAAGQGAKPLTAWRSRAGRLLRVQGLPSPRPPRAPARPRAQHAALVPAGASLSTPARKRREPAGAFAIPEGAPTVQRRAEGLLKHGQSGRQGRGGAESERGLPAHCHLSLIICTYRSPQCHSRVQRRLSLHPQRKQINHLSSPI